MTRESLFASPRERRLWLYTGVAVLGVLATLALSSTLTNLYYSQDVAAAAFLSAMFLIGVSALALGLRTRPKLVEIGIVLGIGVVYGMLLFRMTFPERSHLIEFGVVAMLIYEALSERRRSGRRVRLPGLIAIGATTLIGAMDEVIQIFIPSRFFDPVDIVFNCFAAVLAVTSMAALAFGKRAVMRRITKSAE